MSSTVTNYQLREAANFAEDLWPDGLGFYIAMDLRQRAQTNSPLFMPDFLDPAVADINRLYSEAKSAGLLSSQNRVPESTS